MKTPSTSVTISLTIAASIVCVGVFQACHSSGPIVVGSSGAPLSGECAKPNVVCWATPTRVNPRGYENAHVDVKKNKFEKALKDHHGKPVNLRFCKRKGDYDGHNCTPIYDPLKTTAAIVKGIRAEEFLDSNQVEMGGGDDSTTDAIHVTQQVTLDNEDAKKRFLNDIGL